MEARRLARVTAAFAKCPTCGGRHETFAPAAVYWTIRAVLAVTWRLLLSGAIAYVCATNAGPWTYWLVAGMLAIGGLGLALSAGSKYLTAMRASADRVRMRPRIT